MWWPWSPALFWVFGSVGIAQFTCGRNSIAPTHRSFFACLATGTRHPVDPGRAGRAHLVQSLGIDHAIGVQKSVGALAVTAPRSPH